MTGVVLEAGYRWKSLPAVLYYDAVTINWESSVFNSDGSYCDVGGEFVSGRYVSFASKGPDERANGGCGFEFPITSGTHPGELPISLYGGVSMHLIPVHPIYTTSDTNCSLIMKYGHKYVTVSGGIGFDITGPSVTFTSTVGVDTLSDSIMFYSRSSSGGNV